jgi:hypothetical protein
MSTNRREFLKWTGGLALAGWAGATGLASTAEAAAPLSTTAAASGDAGSLERWLLETGRNQIDGDIYRAVAGGKA